MSLIKHKILVLSGKGGVGKSTCSLQLASQLASDGYKVALLDTDICGPSLPTMTGMTQADIVQSEDGWNPVKVTDNLSVMSIGFLLSNRDDPVIWRGPRKTGMLAQFLHEVNWQEQDFLIIDTPPGSSDEHLSLIQFLPESQAILVTTPQEVAIADVRKEIDFCRKLKLPILGVIENMSGFACPDCGEVTQIFKPTSGGAARMCRDAAISLLGAIPLDPSLMMACDSGAISSAAFEKGDTPGHRALKEIATQVVSLVEK